MKNVYKVFYVRSECLVQEIEADSLEEALVNAENSDNDLKVIDGTMSTEIDKDLTFNCDDNDYDE